MDPDEKQAIEKFLKYLLNDEGENYECWTNTCPHWTEASCSESIIKNYEKRLAESSGYE
jgi:nitrite reductase/ring-hydroxylating ferredoxin subunit